MRQIIVFGLSLPFRCRVDQDVEPGKLRVAVNEGFGLVVVNVHEFFGGRQERLDQSGFFLTTPRQNHGYGANSITNDLNPLALPYRRSAKRVPRYQSALGALQNV